MKTLQKMVVTLVEEVLLLKREGDVDEALELVSDAEEDKILDRTQTTWVLNRLLA